MCEYCEKPNKTITRHLIGVSAFVGAGRLLLRFYDEELDRTIEESLQELRRKGEAMTETEKDAFIVQLRGEVTMYRDAYRATMRMLELANKELRNLRELRNMKEKTK